MQLNVNTQGFVWKFFMHYIQIFFHSFNELDETLGRYPWQQNMYSKIVTPHFIGRTGGWGGAISASGVSHHGRLWREKRMCEAYSA